MNQTSHTQDLFSSSKTTRVAKLAVASKSDPIPIVFAKPKDPILEKDDENYTCVISHRGNSFKKIEYFDVADGLERNSGSRGVFFT
ncbi:hypothetical protein ACQCRO_27860, partial [Ralstonia pseudosolanacearum]|uniref:hypothetical protein n=1 Tax=Ralstonia pseudosolanacearum TaxID=1310165 RepID=UPI003CF16951